MRKFPWLKSGAERILRPIPHRPVFVENGVLKADIPGSRPMKSLSLRRALLTTLEEKAQLISRESSQLP